MGEIFVGRVAEITVTSETILSLTSLLSEWTGSYYNSDDKAAKQNENNQMSLTSTYELVNLTGFPIAITQTAVFNSELAFVRC